MVKWNSFLSWEPVVLVVGLFGELWQILVQKSKDKRKDPSELAQSACANKRATVSRSVLNTNSKISESQKFRKTKFVFLELSPLETMADWRTLFVNVNLENIPKCYGFAR